MEFIRSFSCEDFQAALESWTWLPIEGMSPFLCNAFGEIFLEAEDGIYFLAIIDGKLDKVCDTKEELQHILNTREGQEHYLWSVVIKANYDLGMRPKENEVFDFKVLPALGGELKPENISLCDFIVTSNITGQIHNQIKDLPPGTPISEINLEET